MNNNELDVSNSEGIEDLVKVLSTDSNGKKQSIAECLEALKLDPKTAFKNFVFRGLVFEDVKFEGIDFSNTIFKNCDFQKVEFEKCTFKRNLFIPESGGRCAFSRSEFNNCEFSDVLFLSEEAEEGIFEKNYSTIFLCKFNKCKFNKVIMDYNSFGQNKLTNCVINDWSVSGATLTECTFENEEIKGVCFDKAPNMEGTEFSINSNIHLFESKILFHVLWLEDKEATIDNYQACVRKLARKGSAKAIINIVKDVKSAKKEVAKKEYHLVICDLDTPLTPDVIVTNPYGGYDLAQAVLEKKDNCATVVILSAHDYSKDIEAKLEKHRSYKGYYPKLGGEIVWDNQFYILINENMSENNHARLS